VSSLAVKEPVRTVTAVAVAAETRSMQLRLSSAIAGQPAVDMRVVSSLRKLIAKGATDDLIVSHHETLATEDCESFKALKVRFPVVLIVVVCAAADGRAIRRALDSGIDGLVFADQLEATLRPTITAALAGQISVPRNLRTFMHKPSLSPAERRVLGLLVMGYTNRQIGGQLFLAESTVKSHLASAYTKMGVRSRSEAVSLLLDPKQPFGTAIGPGSNASLASNVVGGRF
jgi:DNA-binding NarL/FixJ family response regulator